MSDLEVFRAAGRALFSLGLVRETEGNLSTFDGTTLVITRTGSNLSALEASDLIQGGPTGPIPGASSDLAVHRERYATDGPGALVHAHPPGTVPEGTVEPGRHGLYVHGGTLEEAVREVVQLARSREAVRG